MTSMSSDQFRKKWRYGVESDFVKDGVKATVADGYPKTWGGESMKIKVDQTLTGGAFSPDEKYLAIGAGSTVQIYDMKDLTLCTTLVAPSIQHISHIEWRPQVEGVDDDDGYMILAKVEAGYAIDRDEEEDPPQRSSILWSLDAFARNRQATAETPLNADALAGIAAQEVSSLLQTRYNWSASEANSPIILKGFTRVLEKVKSKHAAVNCTTVPGEPFPSSSISFSHSGKSFLLLEEVYEQGEDNERRPTINVWDISKHSKLNKRLSLSGHKDSIMWVGFSPDDSMIASSCWDQTLKLWSATTGELIHSFGPSGGQNWAAAFSPNGKFIAQGSGARNAPLTVWNIETRQPVMAVTDVTGWVRSMSWSPDSSRLAFGAEKGALRIMGIDGAKGESATSGTRLQEFLLDGAKMPFGRSGFMEFRDVDWFDTGRKIRFCTGTDDGVEVYDFQANTRWRFETPKDAADGLGWDRRGGGPTLWWKKGRTLVTMDLDSCVRFWPLS